MEFATATKTQTIPILMYHSISNPEQASKAFRPFTLSPALFAQHLAYLREHGYTPICVSEYIAMRQRQAWQDLPERPIMLTFDDGFADFFREALPLLQRYRFPATLYIATSFVNGTSRWLQRSGEGSRQMLTWEQVSESAASGIECGAHSHHHMQLDTLPYCQARAEVYDSKQLLEEYSGKTVQSFAYPHGYHSKAIKQIVREAGFTSACTVKFCMSTRESDVFALPRLFMSADTGVAQLQALLAQPAPSQVSMLYGKAKAPIWRTVRRYSAHAQEAAR
jgi:peptidoglycan/xylan/chitin deacetylase (PgdA/CDA1 family)